MTGEEHRRRAESLVAEGRRYGETHEAEVLRVARAQVHATLALVEAVESRETGE